MTLAEADIVGTRRDTYRFGNGPEPVLQAGTLGWSVDDVENPEIYRLWVKGRYEILDGVLTIMPPAFFKGGTVADNLKFILKSYFRDKGSRVLTSAEVDIAVTPDRVVRADGVLVLGESIARFETLRFDPPATDWREHVLTLPPTIVIESISKGHEAHDRVTKFRWYAEFGVPHYWIVDGYARTLECFRLNGGQYEVEGKGSGDGTVELPSFPGLTISLREVWEG